MKGFPFVKAEKNRLKGKAKRFFQTMEGVMHGARLHVFDQVNRPGD